jgi:FAD/FMN-containing dehydrogenase
LKVVGYGHLYDGNLDLSVVCRQYDADMAKKIETLVFEFVHKHNGAVSAELGCGFRYRNVGHFSKSQLEIDLQQKVKDLFDPKGILNPYKVLPDPK